MMLAQHAVVHAGDVVAHLNAGAGIFAVAASRHAHASRVLVSDRNVLSYEASRRTMIVNEIENAELWLGHGTHGFGVDTIADVVAIRIPHEKAALRQLIVEAWRLLRVGGQCVIAGSTADGAKSAARVLEQSFGNSKVVASEGGFRVVTASKLLDPAGNVLDATDVETKFFEHNEFYTFDALVRETPTRVFTRPGIFSWEHLDEATDILSRVMGVAAGETVLDLGCGSGVLGVVASRLSSGAVTMVDADVEAVRSADRTAHAAGSSAVRTLPSDIAGAVLEERFDVVVTNPPFHIGKATALNVPLQFMRDAHQVLAPGGRCYLVANRTLPYEAALRELFGRVETVHDGARFKVLLVTKIAVHDSV